MRNPPKHPPLNEMDDDDAPGVDLWIVSYADMVTLLFGFFVILYSFSSLDDKKFDQMSEKMAEAFKSKELPKAVEPAAGVSDESKHLRALQMLVAMMNLGDNVDDATAKIEQAYRDSKHGEAMKALLRDKVAANKSLVADVNADGDDTLQTVALVLPVSSLFPPGGYQLTPEAVAKLRVLAGDLHQVATLATVEVEGHTDSSPPAPTAVYRDNFTLSSLRAGAVAAELIRYGIAESAISVKGLGSLRPLVPERDDNGRLLPENMAKNRRVSIVLKLRQGHAANAH